MLFSVIRVRETKNGKRYESYRGENFVDLREFVDFIPVKECQVENVIDIKSESYSDSTGHENDREKVTGEKFDYGYRFRLRRVTKSHHWSRSRSKF